MSELLATKQEGMQFSIRYLPVGDFVFEQGKRRAKLNIQEDITSTECLYLQMMIVSASYAMQCMAWVDYIIDKKLERHFEITGA